MFILGYPVKCSPRSYNGGVYGLRRSVEESLSRIVDFEVKKLISDLNWVEYRLALLGGSEEDEIERRLLSLLRKSIVKDLELLLSYKGNFTSLKAFRLSRFQY